MVKSIINDKQVITVNSNFLDSLEEKIIQIICYDLPQYMHQTWVQKAKKKHFQFDQIKRCPDQWRQFDRIVSQTEKWPLLPDLRSFLFVF